MLKTVIDQIAHELESTGIETVYTAFDYIPIEKKGKEIFTVVGIDNFESSTPIYSEVSVFLPFKAEAAISLIAPKDMTMIQLYDFFDSKVLPAIKNTGSLTCSLRNLSMKNDSNINRLVLKVKFSVSGISKLERSSI